MKQLQLAPQPVTATDDELLARTLQDVNSGEALLDLHESFDADQLGSRWDEIAAGWNN